MGPRVQSPQGKENAQASVLCENCAAAILHQAMLKCGDAGEDVGEKGP